MKNKVVAVITAFTLGLTAIWASATPAQAASLSDFANGANLPSTVVAPSTADIGTLPAAVDLRQWAVPVGAQNPLGSCVSWTVGYALMGWYANRDGKNTKAFAPMSVHTKITIPNLQNALDQMMKTGLDSQDDYVQGNYDTSAASAAENSNALKTKVTSYRVLFSSLFGYSNQAVTAIKSALSQGYPVALAIQETEGFLEYGYVNDMNLSTPLTNDTTKRLGGHAVLALGYDAQGLIIENSWGTTWGDNGWAKLGWDWVGTNVVTAAIVTGYVFQDSPPAMKVSSSSWTVDAGGGTTTITTPSNTYWKVSSLPSWLTATPNSGFGFVTAGPMVVATDSNYPVTLTAKPNTGSTARTGVVSFTTTSGSPAATASVTVSQGTTAASTLSLGKTSWTVSSAAASSTTLTVSSNQLWSATPSASWLTVTPGSGVNASTVTIAAQANTAPATRTASVTFATTQGASVKTATFTVSQPGVSDDCGSTTTTACSWTNLSSPVQATIGSSTDTDWFKITAPVSGIYTFTSQAAASGGIANPYGSLYSASGSLLSYNDNASLTSHQFSFMSTLTAGVVYYLEVKGVSGSTGTYIVTAALPIKAMTTGMNSWSIDTAAASSTTIALASNVQWTASSSASWLTLSQTSGTSSAVLTLSATANPTIGASRGATVTFRSLDGTMTQSIVVTQIGDDCGASTSSYCTWSNLSLPVFGSVDYLGDVDWFKITPATTGNYTFTSTKPVTNPLGNPHGAVYPATGGAAIADNNNISILNYQFSMTAKLTAGQTYFVAVWDHNANNTGNYQVSVSLAK